MSFSATIIGEGDLAEYDSFIERCSDALIYHTGDYLRCLRRILPESELSILGVRSAGALVGTLALLSRDGPVGRIANSLPYFGSHGDVIVDGNFRDKSRVSHELMALLSEFTRDQGFSAINIVSHPVKSHISEDAPSVGLQAWDYRTSFITHLPSEDNREAAIEAILRMCQQKTRNLVRKGLRSGFRIEIEDADASWNEFIRHHICSMNRIGGRHKSPAEFAAFRQAFEQRDQCRLYVARDGTTFAGALMNLYYRDCVEYFAPVAVADYRSQQVVSAIIAHAMCDAALSGHIRWNWGGTWRSQAGVRHFKAGWGPAEHDYQYWGKVTRPEIYELRSSQCVQFYPNYYIYPFGR
ncbi:MAG: hypothetical protein A49_05730 [Methyloceanibacter sp.]|nr:MAG: hypothetical protein A49_05730 [Methyloceanibacter sp.]